MSLAGLSPAPHSESSPGSLRESWNPAQLQRLKGKVLHLLLLNIDPGSAHLTLNRGNFQQMTVLSCRTQNEGMHTPPPACPLPLFPTAPGLLHYTAKQMLKLLLILSGRQIAVCGEQGLVSIEMMEWNSAAAQAACQPLCYWSSQEVKHMHSFPCHSQIKEKQSTNQAPEQEASRAEQPGPLLGRELSIHITLFTC